MCLAVLHLCVPHQADKEHAARMWELCVSVVHARSSVSGGALDFGVLLRRRGVPNAL